MRILPSVTFVLLAGALVSAGQPSQTQTQTQSQPPTRSQAQSAQELRGDLRDAAERTAKATEVFNELVNAPDRGIPKDLLGGAEAVIVIPSLMKGGFIVGAKHGKGIVSVRRPVDLPATARTVNDSAATDGQAPALSGWSGPAFIQITGGTIGWQIGLESVDLVLLVMNRKGIDELLEDRFTLGGALSVAAGPVGRSGNASTNITGEAGVLGYSRAQGLFAGATLEGAGIKNDRDENEAVYGKENAHLRIILRQGAKPAVPLPVELQQWQDTLARLAARR